MWVAVLIARALERRPRRLPHPTCGAGVPEALELMVKGAWRPARRALLLEFGESFMLLELRFWMHDVYNGIRNISSEVMLEI